MTTTSATTASATSKLVTSLGGGTGIDMAELAASLASAQYAGRTDRIASQTDRLGKQISAAGNLKSMLLSLSTSLGDRVRTGDLSPQASVANSSVAKASLSGAMRPKGTFSLEVTALAKAQTLASTAFAASTTPVGSGSLTIKFGTISGTGFTEDTAHAAASVTIASGATLADVATAINAANSGVSAYVAQTSAGAQLVFKGQEGAANGFVIEASETLGDPGLSALAWNPSGDLTQLKASAGDAAYKIDGLAMTSKSNAITDAVPGLNLTLSGTNTGAPTTISFADPTSAITSSMQELVSAFNELANALNEATNAQTGDLAQDVGARALKRSLAQFGSQVIMPGAATGDPKTLAEIGLGTQRDGTFKLDNATLTKALKDNPAGVAAMFTNGLYGVFASFDAMARKATSSGDPGSLGGSITRATALKTKLTAQQSELTAKQEVLRTQLLGRFAKMNSGVGASKSTLSFLQNQIDAWNKP